MSAVNGIAKIISSTAVKIVAILCLTIICITALNHGIDSAITSTISAIIGGVAGYELRGLVEAKRLAG